VTVGPGRSRQSIDTHPGFIRFKQSVPSVEFAVRTLSPWEAVTPGGKLSGGMGSCQGLLSDRSCPKKTSRGYRFPMVGSWAPHKMPHAFDAEFLCPWCAQSLPPFPLPLLFPHRSLLINSRRPAGGLSPPRAGPLRPLPGPVRPGAAALSSAAPAQA